MNMTAGRESKWDDFAPPWAVLVHGSGRPWLGGCFSGMLAWSEDGTNYVAHLKTAIRMTSKDVTIKPDYDTHVIPWKKATVICPTVHEAPGLHIIRVRAKTHRQNGSTLQSIIGMIGGSECGPAFAFDHKEVEPPRRMPTAVDEFWRELQFGFEDELGALMFASLVAGLAEDGQNCFVVGDELAA